MIYNKFLKVFLRQNNIASRFSVRFLRKNRIRSFLKGDIKILEVSGGPRPLSAEYLNIDISDAPEVDFVANILEPIAFDMETIDKIVSVATLEHFNTNDVREILKDFYRLLKKGGKIEIGVPSIEKIFTQYKIRGCDDVVLRYLHGGLKDQYDIHLFVVDAKRFIQELESVGFIKVHEETYDFPRHGADFMMKIVAEK